MASYVMLSTRRGSPDGIAVHWYMQGREYPDGDTPISSDLAEVFVREGWAVDASEFGDPPDLKETKLDVATETTALCGAMTAGGQPCRLRRPCRWHG